MADGDEAPLAGVIYITGSDDIDRLVRRLAVHADLTSPKLSFRTLHQVVAQTREAARAQREAVASICSDAVVVRRATLRYMSQPVSLRLPPSTVERLASRAGRANLAPRTLAQRYVEEGLRMDDHPLIRFVDGPAGRRARLVGTGVDVWEVIAAIKDNDGDIAETAAYLRLALGLVQATVAYYGAFVAEVDEWIERNEHEAAESRAGWLAGQAALQR